MGCGIFDVSYLVWFQNFIVWGINGFLWIMGDTVRSIVDFLIRWYWKVYSLYDFRLAVSPACISLDTLSKSARIPTYAQRRKLPDTHAKESYRIHTQKKVTGPHAKESYRPTSNNMRSHWHHCQLESVLIVVRWSCMWEWFVEWLWWSMFFFWGGGLFLDMLVHITELLIWLKACRPMEILPGLSSSEHYLTDNCICCLQTRLKMASKIFMFKTSFYLNSHFSFHTCYGR